jgi:DNA-3-methyladenine glycosylase
VDIAWEDRIGAADLKTLEPLPRDFYQGPAEEVAPELIGQVVIYRAAAGVAAGRIVECEAYLGARDEAAHAYRGLTPRTRVLFGRPGYSYVYIIYGMYHCLNLVAEPEGSAGCVLIRALEPVAGLGLMRKRRQNARRAEELCSGPGRLTEALGITTQRDYGLDVTAHGRLTVLGGNGPRPAVAVTPRIGIRACRDWPLRFIEAGSRFLSR